MTADLTPTTDAIAEFLRQYEIGRGHDPDVIITVWHDPDSARASLTVADLHALLDLLAERDATIAQLQGVISGDGECPCHYGPDGLEEPDELCPEHGRIALDRGDAARWADDCGVLGAALGGEWDTDFPPGNLATEAARRLAEAREQVAQLTAERDAMQQALEALATHAYSHRDELTDLLDNHAVRLATGETCVLGMSMTCGDAHTAGQCFRKTT